MMSSSHLVVQPAAPLLTEKAYPLVLDARAKLGGQQLGSFRVVFRDLSLTFRHVRAFTIDSVVATSSAVSSYPYLLLRIPELDGFEHPVTSNMASSNRAYCALVPVHQVGDVTRFKVVSTEWSASQSLPTLNYMTFELVDPVTDAVVPFDTERRESWTVLATMVQRDAASHGWQAPATTTSSIMSSRSS